MQLGEAMYQMKVWGRAQDDLHERADAVKKHAMEAFHSSSNSGGYEPLYDAAEDLPYRRVGVIVHKRQWITMWCRVGAGDSIRPGYGSPEAAIEAEGPEMVEHLATLTKHVTKLEKMLKAALD